MRQTDLFDTARPSATAPVSQTPDPEMIRARLQALLQTVRNANEMPWQASRTRTQEHLFHNMANWLPEQERDALRSAFTAEMERLRQAQRISP